MPNVSIPKSLPFVPTHSVLSSFETCPRKFAASYVYKEVEYTPSAPADLGTCVHKIAEWFIEWNASGTGTHGEKLLADTLHPDIYSAVMTVVKPKFPPAHEELSAHWSHLKGVLEKLPFSVPGVKLFSEHKCAIHKDGKGCNYYDKEGAFRAIIDVLVVAGPVAILLDIKSGAKLKDSTQLERAAAVVLANFPEVQVAHTAYVSTRGIPAIKAGVARESAPDIMMEIAEETAAINHSYKTKTFEPQQSGLCRDWCPVKACLHYGGGSKLQ